MSRGNHPVRVILAASITFALSPGVARADDRPAATDENGQSVLARPLKLTLESDRPGTRLAKFDFLGSGARHGFYDVEAICTAPCTANVLPASSYRVVAPGMTPSSVFQLQPNHDVDVRVRGGSWARNVAGTLLSVLGAVYVPVGAGLIGGQEAFGDSRSGALVPVGATFVGIGIVALAVGLPLWLGSRTHVTIQPE
jgi:hypothetical protein